MQRQPTVIFSGGGTGGHLFPGIAVAEELRITCEGVRVVFSGSARAIERSIVTSHGFEHWPLPVESSSDFRRRPHRASWNLWRSYRTAKRLLKEHRPNCIVGLGGFASFPLSLAGWRLRVPLVLLEQNIVPGRATKFLSRFASQVCLSFAETTGRVGRGRNVVITGNPVRREIGDLARARESVRQTALPKTLLILGGSQGALAINDLMLGAIRKLKSQLTDWRIVHQTGEQDLSRVQTAYGELGANFVADAFFQDMPRLYRESSLIVSRAGATTLAELACAGRAPILIPYPHSAGNHQLANARWYAKRAAAAIVEQVGDVHAIVETLIGELSRLIADHSARDAMHASMAGLARPDAAAKVAEVIRRHLA